MKIKNPNLVINITVICSIILALASWFFSARNESQIFWSVPPPDLSLAPGEAIPATIPYGKYIHYKDSIEAVRYLKNGEAGGLEGANMNNLIGTSFGLSCDTCDLKWYNANAFSDQEHKHYYINLSGWTIKDKESDYFSGNFVRFYVKNNQSYIHQNDVDIPVKFRYNHKGEFLMIPVSNSAKTIFNVFLTIVLIVLGFYLLYVIVCFIYFLLDLSRGLVFTTENLRRLLTIAISLLAFPILILLLNLLIKLVFLDYFTKDVVLNNNIFKDKWENIVAGILFLLLYKAFRQGKKLKDEQELTV